LTLYKNKVMTKEELAIKQGSEVRHNQVLFDLFQQFILEDWGSIPAGCFGCDFNKHFTNWAKPYKEGKRVETNKTRIMNADYILKDQDYKTFYKGEVLSKNSSSEEWAKFITENKDFTDMRKKLFKRLPSTVSTDEEKAIENEILGILEDEKKEDLTPLVDAKLEAEKAEAEKAEAEKAEAEKAEAAKAEAEKAEAEKAEAAKAEAAKAEAAKTSETNKSDDKKKTTDKSKSKTETVTKETGDAVDDNDDLLG